MLRDFRTYQLAKEHYRLCKQLRLPGYLHDQLMRASSSVVLNLAEGSGKRTLKGQKNFYSIAYGSLLECRAILELDDLASPELVATNNHLGAMLFKLIRRLESECAEQTEDTKHQTTNAKQITED